jgi:uncharacterized RDD family membrane protein YckC
VRAALIDSVVFVVVFYLWFFFWVSVVDDAHMAVKIAPLGAALLVLEPGLVAWTGGTIGHHLTGLRIRDAITNRNIGFIRATLRALSRVLLGSVSLVFILVTRRHQAIHDYLSRTVVIVRNPAAMPESERFVERAVPEGFQLPSGWRRAGVMVLYGVAGFVAAIAVSGLLISESCLYYDSCSSADNLLSVILSLGWYASLAAILILGWRGQLFGARRRPIDRVAEQQPPRPSETGKE